MTRIVLIDDDDALAESVVRLLDSVADITWVKSGDGAVDLLPADIIICDYDLGMFDRRNGVEICEVLRPLCPDAHFVVSSGLDRKVPDWIEFVPKDHRAASRFLDMAQGRVTDE